MLEIKNKANCSWCHSCYNICPTWAIKMEIDDKGFKYPIIDKKKCINCWMCEKVCPIININKWYNINEAYAMINNNEQIRLNSSSWWIFNLLANEILLEWWIIFWAAFDEDMSVKHISVSNKENLYKLMTSKYLQSNIWDTYKECKKYLETWKTVLFTWTPCQIEWLYSFLQNEYDNLYTQDLICHWAPSPKIRQMYLKFMENKKGIKTQKANFRQKNNWWSKFSLSLNNNKYNERHWNDLYMKLFLQNYILRDSCYSCKFKKMNRMSDITLADFRWVRNIVENMDDDKWTSLVIIHSPKWEKLYNKIRDFCEYKKVDFDKSISFNHSYYESYKIPRNREEVFKEINSNNFDKIVKKYTWWQVKIIKKYINLIFYSIIKFIKNFIKKLSNKH